MKRAVLSALALLLIAPIVSADVTLPSAISDHMVLQRDREVRIWGKADPGEQVSVSFAGNTAQGQANDRGDWAVMLAAMPASAEGRTLTVKGNNTIELKDVLVGEVWVASGQSNMEWSVANSNDAQNEIANSGNDQIRMWTAVKTVAAEPAFDVEARWEVAGPDTTGRFSAVGYFFARKLQKQLGVPVGVLHTSWGGTPVESWISRPKMDTIEWARPLLERYDDAVATLDQRMKEYENAMEQWRATRGGPSNTGVEAGFANADFDDGQWQAMSLPRRWEDAGLDKDGVVWFRRSVEIPADWAGKELKLELGPVDDGDTTYFAGQRVGGVEAFEAGSWQRPRSYTIPAELVKAGPVTIAVRVVDTGGSGGLYGQQDQLKLFRTDGQGEPIALSGDWKYHLAHEIDASNRPGNPPNRPFGPDHPHAPAGLFNGMINPIVPYTIRGAIWYQGESNASRAEQYRQLFPGMIQDWRQRWGQGDFPFLFVQLANYMAAADEPTDTPWAHLRDAQLYTLRTEPNTGMATIIDIGETNDIHPRNKQDVGGRLAAWALHFTYGKSDVVASGPIYKPGSASFNEGKATLSFDLYGGKLAARGDGELIGFTIAGEDKQFVNAQARIQGEQIVVWSDSVADPKAVRYAWADNPDRANLVNEQGMPASPFRTDDWPGPTDGRR